MAHETENNCACFFLMKRKQEVFPTFVHGDNSLMYGYYTITICYFQAIKGNPILIVLTKLMLQPCQSMFPTDIKFRTDFIIKLNVPLKLNSRLK